MKHLKYLFLVALMFPLLMSAQTKVTGTVLDNTKMPIPGASILVKGTTKGKVTDFDGKFTFRFKKLPKVLVVQYLGYKTKEVLVKDDTPLTIVLEEEANQLEEVVVVGYGTVDKKDLTGSITSIKPTKDAVEQSKGVEDIIRGRTAGVQVSANGAEPGSSVSIKIRGTSSLTGNSEPLYVVDGIIMDSATEDVINPISGYTPPQGGGISGINPGDIESIEVLKDASATAIYGSRAANGVIIITTKKGKKGDAKFNFSSAISTGTVVRNIDVLDTQGYARYQNDVNVALGFAPKYTINTDGSIYTTDPTPVEVEGINWAEDTYRNSFNRKNRLSVSGGGEKGDYYISGGMIDNQGTFPNATAKSFDFNMKLNQKLSKKLKLSTKVATTFTQLSATKGTDAFGSTNHSMVRQVILAAPIVNFADNNAASATGDVDENIDGPRAWTTDYDDDSKDIRILGSLTLDYKLSKIFTYRLRFGGDFRQKERSFWYGTALLKGANANGIAGVSTLNRFRYNVDNTLMFRKTFSSDHKINGTVGVLLDKTNVKRTAYSASNFADKSLRADGISFGSTFTPLYVDSEYPSIVSFIGRLNYTLFKKYLFTGTFRADGSSKFAKGNRWGYFPAFSFAWKAKEEEFLKDNKTISDLKVRLGYGEVGNQNIKTYSILTSFVSTPAAVSDASGGNLIAVTSPLLANPDLIWETSIQYNAGVDFGLFNNRLSGSVDVYHKTSKDLLLRAPAPPSSGFPYLTANQGNIQNQGLEIALNGDVISKEDIKWNVFGNISFNKNKITGLGLINPAEYGALGEVTAFLGTRISGGTYFKQAANIFIEGQEVGLLYGLATNGIIRDNNDLISPATGSPIKYKGTDMRVGDVLFVDQNGDGNIDDADNTIIGNPNPDFTFGLGSSFEYKNFSMSLMFNGVYGNDVVNGNLFELGYANGTPKNTSTAAYEGAFDATNNPNGNYPLVAADKFGTDYTRDFNDRAVEDGSFLRLSYVTLGYNLPVENVKIFDSVKLTLSGQNLWLLTKYTGFDPEVNSFSFDPLRTGVDWGSFPNQRSFTIGLNVTF